MYGRWRIAEGKEAPEEFPKVFFNIYSEDMVSLKGPADRVWGHDPVETPRPLSYEYKQEASWKRHEHRHSVCSTHIVSGQGAKRDKRARNDASSVM